MPISPHHIQRPAANLGTAQQIADLGRRVRTLESIYGIALSVDGTKLRPGTVGTGSLGPGSVTAPIIANGAIQPIHISIGAIQSQHIGNGQVQSVHIGAGQVNHTHIGDNEIRTNHIQANTIQANHIAANQITAGHIQANAIQSQHISANAIQAGHIAANQIQATHIAANQIQAQHLTAGSVTANAIAANAITAGAIAANAVTAGAIAANAVTAGTIAANAVDTAQINSGAVNTLQLAAGAVTAGTIASGAVTSDKIAAGAVTAGSIAVGAVTALGMAVGVLSAYIINGDSMTLSNSSTSSNKVLLDATGIKAFDASGGNTLTISSTDGSLTASKGTITGATLQTTTGSTSKVILDSAGIRAYDSGGNNTFNVDTTGQVTIAKGTITLSGTIPAGAAKVTLDATGIKAWNASGTQTFILDSTTGLIQCSGVITAQAGSSLPAGSITGSLPGSANRYSNSSFQNGAGVYDFTGWGIAGGTAASGATTVPPVYGALTCKITCSTTGTAAYIDRSAANSDPYHRVLPGLNYAFSHYEYAYTQDETSRIDTQWYNSAGTLLSTTPGTTQDAALGQWTRVTQVATAPANAAFGRGVHYFALSPTAGDVIYVDAMQMEMGDAASAWAPRPDEILYSAINANNINVSSLAAINANLGAITAGTLTSVSVNSATITGGSLNIGSGTFQVSNTGALTASSATITGTITGSSTITGAAVWMVQGSVSSPPNSQRLYWSPDGGTTVLGNIFSAEYVLSSVTYDVITLESRQHPNAALNSVIASIRAASSTGSEFASLQAVGTSASSSWCYATTSAGTWKATILDGGNNSEFLRMLVGATNRKLYYGQTTITFGGSSIASTPVTWSQGGTPAWVYTTVVSAYANITTQAGSYVNGGFTLTAVSAPGTTISSTYTVNYLVLI